MRFLRRSPEPAKSEPDTTGDQTAAPSGKGRPTPKRREAEARRRGPVAPPPRTQREAMRRQRGNKEERRAERADRRARMMAGDDKYLLPRDRGPVRAYVRDLVDSRRHLMGLFLPLAAVVLVSTFIPYPRLQSLVSLASMAIFAAIIVEALFLGRYVGRRVLQKFPDTKDGGFGVRYYAFGRATLPRRWRTPRPRVGYGQVPD